MTDRLDIIRQLEKEIADKQAALAKQLAIKDNLKKGDIIILLQDLEWIGSRGSKMEVHSVSGGHIHAGVIGKPSAGTYWIGDGNYMKYMDAADYITGIQPLVYRNNWENDVYTIRGHRVLTLEEVSIAGKKYKVTNRMVSKSYSDCGKTYTSTSTHYFVTESVFGRSQEFDLNKLMDRDVKATKYTLEYELK